MDWEPDPGTPLQRYRCRLLVLVFSVLVQALTLGARWGAPDERERVNAAEQLLDHGTLALPGGRHTKYPPLTSVLIAPGVLLKRMMPGHHDAWLMLPPMLASAAAVVPFQRALWAVGVPLGASVVVGALFALVNPTWPYGKRLYSEPFTGLFVLCALAAALAYRTHGKRRSLVLAWLCLAGAAGNNSVVLVLAPVILGMTFRRPGGGWDRRAGIFGVVAGGALGAAWMLVNVVKFGAPFSSGYQDSTIPNDVFDGTAGFSTPMWVGVHGLLFSAGRGVVVYAPLALVGAWALWAYRERWRGAAPWLLAACAVPLLVYSRWWSWHGGTCYGPRLLTPFLGAWMLGLGVMFAEGWRRSAAWVALVPAAVLNIVAAAAGTLFTFSYDQQFWLRDKPFNDFLDVYTPQYSQLPSFLRDATLFPDDTNLLWLETQPRRPGVVVVDERVRVVQVELARQALRDAWEVAEVHGETADGAVVKPVSATAGEGRNPEMAVDGNPATAWLGGTQKAGQWFRVEFAPDAPPLARVVFQHGRGGSAYPRWPVVKTGPGPGALGRPATWEVPRGELGWSWAGWLLWLALAACALGVYRWGVRAWLPART